MSEREETPHLKLVSQPADERMPPLGLHRDKMAHRCAHPHVLVDERARIVECRTCGDTVDPIAALATIADRFRAGWRLRDWCQELRDQRNALERDVARLKRQRQRLAKPR